MPSAISCTLVPEAVLVIMTVDSGGAVSRPGEDGTLAAPHSGSPRTEQVHWKKVAAALFSDTATFPAAKGAAVSLEKSRRGAFFGHCRISGRKRRGFCGLRNHGE